ncbi:MAG: DUF3378 domain-containing protein [Candidatus Diapherotrites archaeon]|nr:DUF3378 domain-containing protein [Candidatus Diapherotrites archaeon]
MQVVLNFKKSEIPAVMAFLGEFEPLAADQYQLYRTKMGLCSVILFESGKLLVQGDNARAVSKRILEKAELPDERVLGIDETGRGEDFGPLVVAAVLGSNSKLREVRDSKKTSDITAKRKIVEQNAEQIVALEYSAATIDELRNTGTNLNRIEGKAIDLLVDFFRQSGFSGRVVVDGSALPVASNGIEFAPKADDSEPAVAAASIIARAVREGSKDKETRKSWKKKEKRPE